MGSYFLQWSRNSHPPTRANRLYYGHRHDWSAFHQQTGCNNSNGECHWVNWKNPSFWSKSPGTTYCTRHTCPLHAELSFLSYGDYQDLLQFIRTITWTTLYLLNNLVFFIDILTKLTFSCNANAGKCTRIFQCPVNSRKRSSACYIACIKVRHGQHCRHKNHTHNQTS